MAHVAEKELLGSSGFPVEIHRLDAADFSHVAPQNRTPFGLDREATTKALRGLADAIERGDEVYLQKITLTSTAAIDDFVMHELRIDYAAPVLPKTPKS